MGNTKNALASASDLRRRAEELLEMRAPDSVISQGEVEVLRLLHELQVHQIELEMQNAELLQARDEMEIVLEKYTDLYEFAPVAYFTLDHTGAIRAANFTAASLLGIERPRLLGRHFRQFVIKEQRQQFVEFFGEIFASQSKKSYEVMLTTESKSPLYVHLEGVVFGAGQECRVAFVDITDSKQAEETLRLSEERHRVLAETMLQGVVHQDASGKIIAMNPAAEHILGKNREQLLGNCSAMEEQHAIRENREHFPDLEHPSLVALRTGLPVRGLIMGIFNPKLNDYRWINIDVVPVFSPGGIRPVEVFSIFEDVTEREYYKRGLEEMVAKRTVDFVAAKEEVETRKQIAETSLLEIKKLKDLLEAERAYLQDEKKLEYNHEDIIGNSDGLKYVLCKIEQISRSNTTVLILGETGTGKDLVARALHSSSLRKNRVLIKVNCATLPANLIESELFGHEKGAFTGSQTRHLGRFEVADGGTLFLDEIGELPLELQAKLLRVIQDGEFERLGSSHTIKVDTRILAATNRNLEEEVRNGRFREDLWYRLNVFPITVPPLRYRQDDIPLLVDFYVKKIAKRIGKAIDIIPTTVMNALQAYHWPGNIRELENVLERAVINSSGPKLRLADELVKPVKEFGDSRQSLQTVEKEHILRVLEQTKWKISGKDSAAEILGLDRSTLRARMLKLNIVKVDPEQPNA